MLLVMESLVRPQRPLRDLAFGHEPKTEPLLELLPTIEPVEEDSEEVEDAAPEVADPLKLYVRRLGAGPLLTRVEERELARRKDEGDELAKLRLIESNLRLVMSITRKYSRAGVPLL